MQEIVLELKKLTLTNFDTKSLQAHFSIIYARNGEEQKFTKQFSMEKSEPIVADIIKTVKELGKVEVQPGDELMGSMFVIRLLQEDKIEEKLYNFFVRVCEKARSLKRETNHAEYMKLFDDIRIQSLTL